MSRQNYYRHRQRRQRRALQQEAVMARTKEERQVQRGLEVGMTEENHCYENAHAERVNGILKREYALGQVLPSLEAAGRAVDQAVKLLQHAPAAPGAGAGLPGESPRRRSRKLFISRQGDERAC